MKKLNKPPHSVIQVLNILKSDDVSANVIRDIDSIEQILIDREEVYVEKVIDNTLFQIPRIQTVSVRVNRAKIISYYEYRLRQKPNGRKFYDDILLSAPHDICPYCTIRTVKTIDHFLPKSEYPSYAITPINLVPCCRDCNTEKDISYPTTAYNQTFHPYFDTIDTDIWIRAKLVNVIPMSFKFVVIKPNDWDQNMLERALNHFNSYNINQLFSNEANRELRGMQSLLRKLYHKHPDLLKEHINDCVNSCTASLGKLDWKTLMYNELLTDEWFLDGCPGNPYFE